MNINDAFHTLNNLSLKNSDNIKIDVCDKDILSATSSIGSIEGNKYLYKFTLNKKLFSCQYINRNFICAFEKEYNVSLYEKQSPYLNSEGNREFYDIYLNYDPDLCTTFRHKEIYPDDNCAIVLDPRDFNNEIRISYFENHHTKYNFE